MSNLETILRLPSTFDLHIYWETVNDVRDELASYGKVSRGFYLRIVHQPSGLFDCTTLKADPTQKHFNKGKVEVISKGHESLTRSKLWMRDWYLKQCDLADVWIPTDGKNDINALITKCKYDGNLNIRKAIRGGKYSIVFSNLKTGKLTIIEKAIKLSSVEVATDMADLWYEKRNVKQNRTLHG